VLNLCFRFTFDLHKTRLSPSPTVRRRAVYELLKHGMGMTCPKAGMPGSAHASTGLSEHIHAASHAGLGAPKPRSPNALGTYLTWACPALRQPTVLQPPSHNQMPWRWTSGTPDGPWLVPEAKAFPRTLFLYRSEKWTRTCASFRLKWLQSLITINIQGALYINGNIFPESWVKLSLITTFWPTIMEFHCVF